ncbi:MAG: Lrp/AsnC ligand binding domain-containing protein [Candidatus Thorarchaeota archaeon]|jgi:DNA-binding Lrp family transcriptional regulator
MSLAFVLVNTEIGREKEVLGMLRALPDVRDAYEVYGVYDIILRVEADSRKAFQEAVSVIRRVAGVRSTLTMVVISE